MNPYLKLLLTLLYNFCNRRANTAAQPTLCVVDLLMLFRNFGRCPLDVDNRCFSKFLFEDYIMTGVLFSTVPCNRVILIVPYLLDTTVPSRTAVGAVFAFVVFLGHLRVYFLFHRSFST